MSNPLKVLITGAAGQIAYSLLHSIAAGHVFGKEQPVSLVLLDITPMLEVLRGVEMELQDCALPLLKEVIVTDTEQVAFTGIDVAILAGAMPRREGMERKDLLAANVRIFKSQGIALNTHAKKNVKVLVVGNPANTNALICQQNAPSIPKENFTCLTRLDQNRAQAQIAARVGVSVSDVRNVVIWGNHSSTQYPDVNYSTVVKNGETVSAYEAVLDDNWLHNSFITTVQQRGAAVIKARKLSSAMSAAKAIADHMRDWWFGTGPDTIVSMGVTSDGNSYGVPEGLIFSFPVRIGSDQSWTIVKDLKVSDFGQTKIDATAAELTEERDLALSATSH